MDVVVIFIILLIVALVFKRLDNTIIFFGIIDIFLRIVDFIGNNTVKELNNFINKYLPASIEAIIKNYSSGTLELVLVWIYVILMALFLYYVFRMLLHRL